MISLKFALTRHIRVGAGLEIPVSRACRLDVLLDGSAVVIGDLTLSLELTRGFLQRLHGLPQITFSARLFEGHADRLLQRRNLVGASEIEEVDAKFREHLRKGKPILPRLHLQDDVGHPGRAIFRGKPFHLIQKMSQKNFAFSKQPVSIATKCRHPRDILEPDPRFTRLQNQAKLPNGFGQSLHIRFLEFATGRVHWPERFPYKHQKGRISS
jgi:hypothetical protein